MMRKFLSRRAAALNNMIKTNEVRALKKIVIATAGLMTAAGIAFLLLPARQTTTYRETKFAIRHLGAPELARLSHKGLLGDCGAAYMVARHHLYFSADYDAALRYMRIAAQCPNANALAHVADFLSSSAANDEEVNRILIALMKIDKQVGEAAAKNIELKREERKYRARSTVDRP